MVCSLLFSLRAESSVNHQARTSDVGSLGSREIGDHPGDFLGCAVARQRIHLLEHLSKLAVVRIHFRIHRAGLHIVDRGLALRNATSVGMTWSGASSISQ